MGGDAGKGDGSTGDAGKGDGSTGDGSTGDAGKGASTGAQGTVTLAPSAAPAVAETAISVALVEVSFEAALTPAQVTSLEKLVADQMVLADPNLQSGDVLCVATMKSST